jgi:hypothetical protein
MLFALAFFASTLKLGKLAIFASVAKPPARFTISFKIFVNGGLAAILASRLLLRLIVAINQFFAVKVCPLA